MMMMMMNIRSRFAGPVLALVLLGSLILTQVKGGGFDLNQPPEMEEPDEDPDSSAVINTEETKSISSKKEPEASSWIQKMRDKSAAMAKLAINKLPEYFDFEAFKRQFKRKYSGPAESLYRKMIFLQKSLHVFSNRVAFRLGNSDHIDGTNKFSDIGEAEFKRIYMTAPPFEFATRAQQRKQILSEQDYYKQAKEVERKRLKAAKEEETYELVSQSSAAGPVDNSQPPDIDSIYDESQVKSTIEHLLSISAQLVDKKMNKALRDELAGVPSETFSQSCLDGGCGSAALPWPFQHKSSQQEKLFSSPPSGIVIDLNADPADLPDAARDSAADRYRAPKLDPNDKGLDWSQHECFHSVYDQGKDCGKCYVMASTALVEFYKCTEQFQVIDQRKFSKDYVFDCAQFYSPRNMGCAAGSLLDTLRFIAEAGIHNIRGWRERRKEEIAKARANGERLTGMRLKCPLDKLTTPIQEWGGIRIEMNPQEVPANQWLLALQDGPLVVSVQMPDVQQYKQGVNLAVDCEKTRNWHAMLLVGYATSDKGVPYWRFRNSWGPDWGEKGHINLAMNISADCLAGGVRLFREPLNLRTNSTGENY